MGDSPAKPFVALLLFLAAFITVSIFMLSLSPTRGQAVQDTTRTHELMGLQLSKEQVQTGSLEGHVSGDFLSTVGYVTGVCVMI